MSLNDRVIAIHQPNFFPWLGYFNKIARSDLFIFLDDVAYPKSGNSMSSWTNRVQIMINGQPAYVRCPVIRKHGVQQIKDVFIDESSGWRKKLIKTLEYNYRKHPYFNETYPILSELVVTNSSLIYEYNIEVIQRLCALLDIEAAFRLQSEIEHSLHSTDLLVELVSQSKGSYYLCGAGAGGYQEDDKFEKAGINLIYQNYHNMPYKQHNLDNFYPGLSIIDILMNCGWSKTSAYIRSHIDAEDLFSV